MKKGDELKLIDLEGSPQYSLEEVKKTDNNLEVLAGKFFLRVTERARALGLINTGDMISDDNLKSTITRQEDITSLDMYMVYYADFVNQGVKGVKSSRNAPDSPYQYKNLGMSEEGRKSILRSVTEGKMKASDTSKVSYGKIGLEGKSKDTPNQAEINQKEAERIIYLIKAYGIKTTNFINDAWEDWKKDLGPEITKVLGPRIIAELKIVNK
jgi:hypothetical protein